MLSREAAIQEAKELYHSYRPNDDVLRRIGGISVGLLIGPSSVGKSYLIKKTCELDARFSEVGTLTTRDRKDGDSDTILSNTPFEDMLEDIKDGNLVQYEVHPTTGDIYATDQVSYQTPYALLPFLPNNLEKMEQLPFKKIVPIGIVASEKRWRPQLIERRVEPSYKNRLEEAAQSIKWLREARKKQVPIVRNFGDGNESAQTISALIKDEPYIPLNGPRLNDLLLQMQIVVNIEKREL